MKQGFRQSMSWLHGWSGLILGWLLFAIFLTGTIAYFRQEVTLWMQPELHGSIPSPQAADIGLAKLTSVAPQASAWTINLPNDRNDTVRVSWQTQQPGERSNNAMGNNRQNIERQRGNGMEQTSGAGERDERSNRNRGNPIETRSGGNNRAAGDAIAPRNIGNERQRDGRPDQGAATTSGNNRSGNNEVRGGGGGRGQQSLTLDATTGEVLTPRETAGGNFLYRFHFELYALPRDWARWIVGIATLAMFVAIISGIITHKKIFKDFFTFRPAKGQRSWLDAHNATAVLALPFHIMITYSGLLLFTSTLLPWASSAIYGDNPRAAFAAMRAAEQQQEQEVRAALAKQGGGPMVPLGPLLKYAEDKWKQPASRILISEPGKPGSIIELLPTRNDSLVRQSGSGGLGDVRMTFNAATGELVQLGGEREQSTIAAINSALGSLHRARFASPGLRWLFFLSGVGGTIMMATGLVLWSVKRAEKNKLEKLPFGHRLVDHLNVGAVAGLFVAVAAYFWANRLLPVDLAARNEWEINVFFIVWAIMLLYPLLRPIKKAWIEQFSIAGALFALIPILNAATTSSHLAITIARGQWMIVGFDIVSCVTGLMLFYTAYRIKHYKGPQKAERKPRKAPAIQSEMMAAE